ncbi:serine/threonine protein kinase [Amycolatopsis sp. NPDC051071]|uniref:serine/threonine protein kinase n=1 Tax=Amycolatopsis sp. NPDC051071 TaxID=3154637 RepID=UPI0034145DEC
MDDDDVSVADLLIREGWDDHEESRSKSRWRVIAVVIAVVVACGAAGVLVGFDSDPEQNAQPNQISVIEMPKRPSDNGGAGATSAQPSTVPGGTGEGTDETSSQPSKPTSSRRTSSAASSKSDTPDPTTPTSASEPADPPKPTGSTGAPQPPHHPTPAPPSTTTPTEECNLWPKWLWC